MLWHWWRRGSGYLPGLFISNVLLDEAALSNPSLDIRPAGTADSASICHCQGGHCASRNDRFLRGKNKRAEVLRRRLCAGLVRGLGNGIKGSVSAWPVGRLSNHYLQFETVWELINSRLISDYFVRKRWFIALTSRTLSSQWRHWKTSSEKTREGARNKAADHVRGDISLLNEQKVSYHVRVPTQAGGGQIAQRNRKRLAPWNKTSELWACTNH